MSHKKVVGFIPGPGSFLSGVCIVLPVSAWVSAAASESHHVNQPPDEELDVNNKESPLGLHYQVTKPPLELTPSSFLSRLGIS